MRRILQKTHALFLYVFVFLLPWQTIWIIREVFYGNEKWQYGTIGIYASDFFLLLWIFISVYLYADRIGKWVALNKKMLLFLLCTELWIFASIMWASDSHLAIYRALIISCAFDLFLILWIVPFSLYRVSIMFIASACIQAAVGISQFLTQNTTALSYFGIQFHDIFFGGTATVTVYGERWLRAYGGLPHPNILGGLLLCAIILLITLYITTQKQSLLFTFFSLFACSILTFGIIVTFSRAIWLTGCISLCLLFTYFLIYTKKISSLISPIITILITILALLVFFNHLFFTRIVHDTQLSHNSIDDRKTYIAHALTLIKDAPFSGTGIGNYTNTAYNSYEKSQPIWFFQPVHNMYILILAEIGIVGWILFLFVIVFFLKILQKTRLTTRPFHVACALILFSFCIISFFDHWIWSSHFGILLCALFIGLFLKTKKTDVF